MDKKLGKGILIILLANVLNLVFNILTNFILPKHLSVDSYSAIKTFQLYVSFFGIFSIGYADGMYLRYGGKELKDIDNSELRAELNTMRLFLLIESVMLIIFSIFIWDRIFFSFALTIISLNMSGCYINLFQAVGEFKKYGRIMNLTTGLTFAVNILLVFLFKTDNYFIYLLCYVGVNTFIWLCLEYLAHKSIRSATKPKLFSLPLFVTNVKSGILLMIGNFSSILLTSMDRWFVKLMMDSFQFAQYSFAVSLEGFLNAATTPITITLYNFFCRKNDVKTVISARKLILIFASLIISLAFPAKFVIEIYLNNYMDSLQVLFILFGAQIFFIPNKAVYVNLYKAKRKQKLYFIKLVAVIICGAILNGVFVYFLHIKEAFAYATLVSSFIWICLSQLDFKEYRVDMKEVLYVFIEIFAFILSGYFFSAIIGFAIYFLITVVVSFLLFKSEILKFGKSIILKKRFA